MADYELRTYGQYWTSSKVALYLYRYDLLEKPQPFGLTDCKIASE